MALKFANGAVIGFSTAYDAAVTASAISNANPAVATVPTGSVAPDSVVIVKSGWAGINERVAVAGTEVGGALPLLGIDTTSTNDYPAGQGAGSVIAVSTFVDFSQQGDLTTSGGEQQFWTGQFLEDRSGRQIQVPTFKNAKTLTLPLYFDASLPWYDAAVAADRAKEPVVLRIRLPDGDTIYRYGYMSFDSDPTLAANNPMQVTMTFSALTEPTLVEA